MHIQWDLRELYIPSYMHICPACRKKSSANLLRPRNENWHAHYFLCACSMATNAYISRGNLQDGWAHTFSLLVLQVFPIHLEGLHVLYNTLTCTVHVHKPTVRPEDRCRLFFNIQVVTCWEICLFVVLCRVQQPGSYCNG